MAGKSAIRHTLGERIFDTFNVVLMIFFGAHLPVPDDSCVVLLLLGSGGADVL